VAGGILPAMSEETNYERLTRLFRALRANEPEQWAASEDSEDIPQLARLMLLRQIWRDVDRWGTNPDGWIEGYLNDPATATTMAEVMDAGVPSQALGLLARQIALETAFSIAYRLDDPTCDYAPDDITDELPGWVLMETSPDGELTSRNLDSLHEDLGGLVEEVAEQLTPAPSKS
jgi:hypothetical protein